MMKTKHFYLLLALLFAHGATVLAQPSWTQSQDFAGEARSKAVSFTLNGNGYVGLGENESGALGDFWKYNSATSQWTKIADFGGVARRNATAFVLNGKAYVGLGQSGEYPDYVEQQDFWEYDPTKDTWTETTPFGGSARYSAIAFTQNNKGFITLGRNADGYPTDVWSFDPNSKIWTEKNTFAGDGRIGGFVFNLDGAVYIGHGVNYEGGSTNIQNNYFSYNATNDSWTEVDILPATITLQSSIFYFSKNGKGYFGGGGSNTETWEFDPAANTFTSVGYLKNDTYNLSSATAFVIDTIAYVATGYYAEDFITGYEVSDFYKFGEGLITPNKPSGVEAKIISATEVEISWSESTENVIGFYIEKSVGSSDNFAVIDTLDGNTTSYIDNEVVFNQTYFYRIRGYIDGLSGYSATAQINFKDPYLSPKDLTIADNSAKNIRLIWNDQSILEDGFVIERSENDTLNWQVIDSVAKDVNTYLDYTAESELLYYYRVKGYYGQNETGYSNYQMGYLFEQGAWQPVSAFPGTGRKNYITCTIDNKVYLGTGTSVTYNRLADFWEYDLDNNTWKQLKDFPGGARSYASALSINGKIYVGLGVGASTYNDLWEYDPQTDNWNQVADFPGVGNYAASTFVIDNKGYLLMGLDASKVRTRDFWEYDPATNTWTQKQDFPGDGRYLGIGTAVNGMGYAGFGSSLTTNDFHRDFYAYDANSNTWTEKSVFPGKYDKWKEGMVIPLGNKIIMGTGEYNNNGWGESTNIFWEYDTSTDQWTPFGKFQYATIGHQGFSYNDELFAFGVDANTTLNLYKHFKDIPAPPTELNTIAKLDTVVLSWQDQSLKETGFIIERRVKGTGNFEVVDTTTANIVEYADVVPEDLTRYEYRVMASNEDGKSSYIEAVSDYTQLRAPDSLVITVEENGIYFEWNNNTDHASYMQFSMSANDTLHYEDKTARMLREHSINSNSFVENTKYFVKIRAVTNTHYSNFAYGEFTSLLNSPQGFALNDKREGILFYWEDRSDHESGFQLEQSIGDENKFETIAEIPANDTTYLLTNPVEETVCYYRIKAISNTSESKYSTVEASSHYHAPTDLEVKQISIDSVEVSWTNASEKAPTTLVRKTLVKDGKYTNYQTQEVDSSQEKYIDKKVLENSVYLYYVQATNSHNFSQISDTVEIHTMLYAPSLLQYATLPENKIELNWDNNTSANNYQIVLELANGSEAFMAIDTLEAFTDNYVLEGLTPNVAYKVRIKAFTSEVRSPYSEELIVKIEQEEEEEEVPGEGEIPTGIEEEAVISKDIILSPNPVENQFRIQTEEKITSLEILSVTGKSMVQFPTANNHIYEINMLPSGVYLVSIMLENQRIVHRIIKK